LLRTSPTQKTNIMDKFMLIFHNEADRYTEFLPSPEEMQVEMQKWNQWIAGIAAQGKFVGTEALMPFGKQVKANGSVVTDGPYTEGKEVIGGYSIVSAANLDEAITLAHGCPIFDVNGTVEVRPVVNFAQ
jgi:hypothetical protein